MNLFDKIKSFGLDPEKLGFIPENKQLKTIKQNVYLIFSMKNPSEQVQLVAVKKNPYLIQYINNPTKKVQLEAIKQLKNDSHDIIILNKLSNKILEKALKELVIKDIIE